MTIQVCKEHYQQMCKVLGHEIEVFTIPTIEIECEFCDSKSDIPVEMKYYDQYIERITLYGDPFARQPKGVMKA